MPYFAFLQPIAEWDWLVFLLCLPIVVFISFLLLPLLLIFPILLLIRRLSVGRFVPPTVINGPLMLLLVMTGVSLYATYDVELSLRKVVGLVYGILLFWSLVHFMRANVQRVFMIIGLLVATGWGVLALGLLAGNLQAKVPLLWPLMEMIYGTYDLLPVAVERSINPNEIGGALLWVLPMAWILLYGLLTIQLSLPPLQQIVILGIMTLSTFAFTGLLIITQSRGALLGFAVAMLLVGWLAGTWPRRLVKAGILSGLILLILLILLTDVGFVVERLSYLGGFSLNPVGAPDEGIFSLTGRLEIWARGIYGLQDFPFTGMGMNTFRRIVHVLYPFFTLSPETDIAHAHNHLLQAGLDLGIPGLVAYLALWIAITILLVRKWRDSDAGSWERLLVLGSGGSLLAYFVFGIVDAIALGARPGFIFWILLAISISVGQLPNIHKDGVHKNF
ncbi:MAG: O-antigen ligase family protein [Chloroflexota bacterium]